MATRTTYSEDVVDEVLSRIAAGESLTGICKDKHLPTRKTFCQWLDQRPALYGRYVRARELQADSYADKIADTSKRLLDGEVDPNAARVAIDGFKWIACKLRPGQYGEKIEAKVEHTGGGYLEILRQLDERHKREQDQQPGDSAIDITPPTNDRARLN